MRTKYQTTRAPARGRFAGGGEDLHPRGQRPPREEHQPKNGVCFRGFNYVCHLGHYFGCIHHECSTLQRASPTLRRARRRVQRTGPARGQLLRLLVLRERNGGEEPTCCCRSRAPRSALRPVGCLGQSNALQQYRGMLDQRQKI